MPKADPKTGINASKPLLDFSLRLITNRDNTRMAAIIRQVMNEFGAGGPGFAVHDAEVDHMSEAYSAQDSRYWVVEHGGAVMGGGGLAPLTEGETGVCELRKMYFLPQLRGCGAGRLMMRQCLDAARKLDYSKCYIETLAGMDAAMALYISHGFTPLPRPLGNTGHFGCNRFYIRTL